MKYKRPVQNVVIRQSMHSCALIDNLIKIISTMDSQTFESSSFTIVSNQIKHLFLSDRNLYDSSLPTSASTLNISLSPPSNPTSSFIYGKFGFLRLSKLFFQELNQSQIAPHLVKYSLKHYKHITDPFYSVLIKSILLLKHSISSSPPESLLPLLQKLSDLSKSDASLTSLFPSFHSGLLIFSMSKSSQISLENLSSSSGILSKICKRLNICIGRPNSVYKLMKSSTSRQMTQNSILNPSMSFYENCYKP